MIIVKKLSKKEKNQLLKIGYVKTNYKNYIVTIKERSNKK